jgi:hypothetical protein
LQFRRRQFAVAVVGASLVFALTLVLTGMSAGFRFEARETVGAIDADAWIVTRGVRGPFSSATTLPEDIGRGWSGVRRAEPLVEFGEVARLPDGTQKNVNVIGHPTGRIINHRPPNALDLDTAFAVALETGTALETNGLPDRLDLKDEHVRQAVEAGIPIVVSTDAHSTRGLGNIVLALGTARRGWRRWLPR